MDHPAIALLDHIIAALTYDEIERSDARNRVIGSGDAVPLLQRSIGLDLLQIEAGMSAKGKTLLSAIAASIDEALTAAAEARQALAGGTQ